MVTDGVEAQVPIFSSKIKIFPICKSSLNIFSFESGDGIQRSERAVIDDLEGLSSQGHFQYLAPNGEVRRLIINMKTQITH